VTTSIARVQARLLAEYERQKRHADAANPVTVGSLLSASGLPLTRSALHRKLHGTLKMSLSEAEAIGKALGVRVTVAVTKRAA
jgi:hypothetical protein